MASAYRLIILTSAFALAPTLISCQGNISQDGNALGTKSTDPGADGSSDVIPFTAYTPTAYLGKVKTILTGQAPTDAEIAAVTKDPTALKGLIATWQQLPAYQPKMIHFLSNAFQQSNVFDVDFVMQGVAVDAKTLGAAPSAMLIGNLREMFARTVLMADAAGTPFNQAMSTSTFAMTAPLAAYYATLDTVQIDDNGKVLAKGTGNLKTTLATYTAQDYNTWRPVTISQPTGAEKTTLVTDAAIKTGSALVLKTPRVSFFTTPTFLAGWQTNSGNEARVTMNQTLIVALNHSFDGAQTMMPQSVAALDNAHAPQNSACFSCHINLDPMRQFFRQSYSLSFSVQNDPNELALPGMFAFAGMNTAGKTIYDLGTGFANHPALASAWVQKLCTYANDSLCDPTDPEFVRIATAFSSSQSLSKLVQDLFSSPLVTYASPTQTASTFGQTLSVTKTDHLCPLFATRLGLTDPCGVAPGAAPTGTAATVKLIEGIMPADGYNRGAVPPVFANDPTLFFRAGMENVCAVLATQVVDVTSPGGVTFSSKDPATAVAGIVHTLMGVPASDDQEPISILTAHYNDALGAGIPATNAMQSTFVAACLSAGVIGLGE